MEHSKAATAAAAAREDARAPEPVERKPATQSAEKPLDEWATVRELALRHLDRFISLEPKVLRGDDPDAIHDMRVASRRLQQVLDLLYPPPPPGEIRALRRKIRRARRALSNARNCDVLIQRVESARRRKRAARREIWTAVEHFLIERRAEHFERALRKLSKVNLAVFYVHLRRFLAPAESNTHSLHSHPNHAQLLSLNQSLGPEAFYQRIGESLEKLHGAFRSQVELADRDPRAPVVHGVRVTAKRLRYLIEVLEEFKVAGSAEALAWLRGLQQHLGDWHDFEVLEELMIEMVARPVFLRDHLEMALGVEKLILKNRETKKQFLDRYFQMLREPEGPRRLNDWVAYVLASPSAAFAKT
jgi:CHAD domain-containing protein